MYNSPILLAVSENMNYGDSVYGDTTYGVTGATAIHTGGDTTSGVKTAQAGGQLNPVLGQNILLFVGLALLIIGAVLAIVVKRKKNLSSIQPPFPHYPNLG